MDGFQEVDIELGSLTGPGEENGMELTMSEVMGKLSDLDTALKFGSQDADAMDADTMEDGDDV